MSWRSALGGFTHVVPQKELVPQAPAVGKNNVSTENVLTEQECERNAAGSARRAALKEKHAKAEEILKQRDLENQKNLKSDVDSDDDDANDWAASRRKSSAPAALRQSRGKPAGQHTGKVSFSSGKPAQLFCTKSGAMPKAVRPHALFGL